jgi:O-antigen ligase
MNALMVSIMLIVMWIVPYIKVTGPLALWHIVLALTWLICISRIQRYIIDKNNHVVMIGILILPLYMIMRDAIAGKLEVVGQEYYLRNIGGYLASIVMGAVMSQHKDRQIILYVLLFIGMINGIVGVLQFMFPENYYEIPQRIAQLFGGVIESGTYVGRVRGLFVFVDKYGMALGMLLLVFIPFCNRRNEVNRWYPNSILVLIGCGIMLPGLLFTYLRVFYIGFALAGMLHVVLDVQGARRKVLTSVVLVATIFVVSGLLGITSTAEWTRITSFNDNDNSNSYRFYSINTALQSIRENPLFGVGGRQVDLILGGMAFEIHNAYLKLCAYYGYAGCLAYLIMLVALFVRWKQTVKDSGDLAKGLRMASLYYLVYCMAHPTMIWLDGFFEWTFVGILLGCVRHGIPPANT